MDETVIPFDLARILLGGQPLFDVAEIVFRTVVIYLYTLALLRWIGGRSVAQLSMVEFLLVIALGSAVGDAVLYPDVPLIHAMAAITAVVTVNKLLDIAVVRSTLAKRTVKGCPRAVLHHGRILPDALAQAGLGPEELMSLFRVKGIRNLGELDQVFLEADGHISLFRHDPPRPGLSIVPPVELSPPPRLEEAEGAAACCTRCGLVAPAEGALPDLPCPACGHRIWTLPVVAGGDARG